MSVWFTADTHFGHQRIIRYCGRPFESISEMDEHLIQAWNARVEPKDTVYHLGDFALASPARYIHRLNGRIMLVRGNHDMERGADELQVFKEVHDMITLVKQNLVLCHYPMRSWPRIRKGAVMLHGHAHGRLPPLQNSVDVGVDVWGYAPASVREVMDRVKHVNSAYEGARPAPVPSRLLKYMRIAGNCETEREND